MSLSPLEYVIFAQKLLEECTWLRTHIQTDYNHDLPLEHRHTAKTTLEGHLSRLTDRREELLENVQQRRTRLEESTREAAAGLQPQEKEELRNDLAEKLQSLETAKSILMRSRMVVEEAAAGELRLLLEAWGVSG